MNTDRQTQVVLIADDEAPIAALVAAVVEDAGYVAVVADHGRQAIELARQRWPSLVITDMMMPQLSGGELIAELRALASTESRVRLPIIAMTAGAAAQAKSSGADAVLRKPFDLDQLELLLHRFLD